MGRLSAIGVCRLRTLYDISPPIPLRPITVLVGRNSVGKSTFARLFPLLRQSAAEKKRGPILWFGDLVDYGTLSQAVTHGETDLELILEFDDLTDKHRRGGSGPLTITEFDTPFHNGLHIERAVVSMTMAEDATSESTYTKQLKITVAGTTICLRMNSSAQLEHFSVGDTPFSVEPNDTLIEQGRLLPRLIFIRHHSNEPNVLYRTRFSPWRSMATDLIHSALHRNTSKKTAAKIASQIPVADPDEIRQIIKRLDGPPTWNNTREILARNDDFIGKLVCRLIAANIEILLEMLDDTAGRSALGVRYLKPLRATAERYYRRADLSVSEIDPDGHNLPMFLDSLSKNELSRFRRWLNDNLNVDVEPNREGAQVVIMAKTPNDSRQSNVADMGFGISQVLPIAAQLWLSSNRVRSRSSPTSFVVVEQPELHLHPAFQATLGSVIAAVACPKNRDDARNAPMHYTIPPRIVVETHSPHLVNRLGHLIEEGHLKPDDVSIVLFEANESRVGTSTARLSKFDEQGVLLDWPFGFFEPDI